MDSFQIKLQGATWTLQINPWPYEVGRPWLTKIIRILGSLATTSTATGGIGIDEILASLDETVMDRFIDECERQTVCVGPDKKAVPFSKLAPLLRARYDVTVGLTVRHVKVTFAPSFASLGSVLADLAGEAPTEGAAGT